MGTFSPTHWLIAALNLGAMMLAAAANPLIKHDAQPAFAWVNTWLTPLIVAGVAYGVYFAVARQRARALWPKGFFVTAWVVLAIVVSTPYMEKSQQSKSAPAPQPISSGASTQAPTTAPAAFQFDPATARKFEENK